LRKKGQLSPIKEVKSEIRILSVAFAKLNCGKFRDKILAVGVIFRGRLLIEGFIATVLSRKDDVTEKLIKWIKESPHYMQIRVVVFPTFNDFKVDLTNFFEKTGLPILVIGDKLRSKSVEKNGCCESVSLKVRGINKLIDVNAFGLNEKIVRDILKIIQVGNSIECLRVSDEVAKLLVKLCTDWDV